MTHCDMRLSFRGLRCCRCRLNSNCSFPQSWSPWSAAALLPPEPAGRLPLAEALVRR